MKNQDNFYHILALIIAVGAVIGGIHKVCSAITSIRYVTLDFDSNLSPLCCQLIKRKVALSASNGTYNPETIIQSIPADIRSIQSIEMQHLPYHTALITVHAFEPIARINVHYLLLENQSIVSADHYAEYSVAPLHAVTVPNPVPLSLNTTIVAGIKASINEKVFDYYTFYIGDENEWYLHDKHDPAFTICCNASALPISFLQTTYEKLKKKMKNKIRAQTKWTADIRFRNQIILSMDKRGSYGKGI